MTKNKADSSVENGSAEHGSAEKGSAENGSRCEPPTEGHQVALPHPSRAELKWELDRATRLMNGVLSATTKAFLAEAVRELERRFEIAAEREDPDQADSAADVDHFFSDDRKPPRCQG